MKNTNNILSALTIVVALTAGFTACSNDELTAEQPTEQAVEQSVTSQTYTVSIPATMPDNDTRAVAFSGTSSTSTFTSAEKIYVYNTTKSAMLGGYLQPTNISANGKGCDLTGTLWGNTIEAGDELQLFYNMNNLCSFPVDHMYYDKGMNLFYYTDQDGTQSTIVDGAEATATVSDFSGGTLTTTATASFQSVQSLFRFQFKDENNNAINVKELEIKSKNDALVDAYRPLTPNPIDMRQYADYDVTLGTATTDYIYVAICIDETLSAGDELTFTVVDANDNEYKGTRSVPTGGFKNGKYYYNTSAIQLTKVPAYLSATTSDIGKVIGADGNIYSNCGAACIAGTTAMAIIAYIGSDTGEPNFTHGLALALKDANHGNECKWKTADTNDDQTEYDNIGTAVNAKESGLALSTGKNSSTYPAFQAAINNTITPDEGLISAAAPSQCSGWFMPSIYQWNKIINGLNGTTDGLTESSNDNLKYTVANQKLDSANGYAIKAYTWASTEYDWNGKYRGTSYLGAYGRGTYVQKTIGTTYYVRAAFAF